MAASVPPCFASEVVTVVRVRVVRAFRNGDTGQVVIRGAVIDVSSDLAAALLRWGYAEAIDHLPSPVPSQEPDDEETAPEHSKRKRARR